MPSKTTKIPLRFRQLMTTGKNSHASLLKGLDLSKPLLPKGWVYKLEEVRLEVKVEVVDPAQYQMLDAPLMRSKHKALAPPDDHHLQSPPASNTIKAQHSFLSTSETSMVVKCRHVTSAPTSTPLTLL
jgi:hypothetical protein